MTDDLDRLIGEVARGLTARPPRDGFAQRVARRLAGERPGARRRAAAWLLAPAAAACVLALAVFLARETRTPEPPPAIRTARSELVAPPVASTEPRRAIEAVRRESRTVPPATANVALPDDLAVAPLAVPPIDVPPLARGDQIDIAAIALERIEIAPMP